MGAEVLKGKDRWKAGCKGGGAGRGSGLNLLRVSGEKSSQMVSRREFVQRGGCYLTNTGSADSVSLLGKGCDLGQVVTGGGRYSLTPFKAMLRGTHTRIIATARREA